MTTKQFNGVIRLDVRDSIPDWEPYLPPKAPKDAPNILFVLFDDTGLAAWEPYGGNIKMPTLQKIANKGLIYTQWHTAALCSPTRGMLLTGRNHHLNGNSSITEGANGFPGQHARMPDECATVAQILQDAGWSTFWVGKNHNVPETDVALGSTKKQWPLAKGFDRFYGFIGGETNQFFPDLIADNHPVEQPYVDGYHLSKDLADQAIQMIKDQKASNPSKPWYMWFCPGANHAPHQILDQDKKDILSTYYNKEGDFDFSEGYEAYREWVLPRMKDRGILPQDTELTPLNPLPKAVENEGDRVIPWDKIGFDENGNLDEEKQKDGRELFTKLMEIYAAFSTYTDLQVGRIIDYLEQTNQLDNTLIIWAADNGASGEGSPNGSVNENKFFNGYPDTLEENLDTVKKLKNGFEDIGGADTYEHYPTGWAAATSTPFKMFKRYSEYAGGTCDPMVMSWPKRFRVTKLDVAKQQNIRHQYHHATDIVPTILEACGLEMPEVYKGVKQYPLSGVSMCYTWDAKPDDPTKKVRQYYAMLGTRGIWENGWKAACLHAPLSGKSNFDEDEWELYHVDEDRSEFHNLANSTDPAHQKKLQQLIEAWFEEAHKNLVLPLDDRSAAEQANIVRPTEEGPREEYTYYPGASPVPESVAVSIRGCSYTIRAEVTLEDGCEGVIFAHGSRFGGHSLFIKEGKLYYVYNFLGIKPEYKFFSSHLLRGLNIFVVEFTKTKAGQYGESEGNTTLYVNDKLVHTGFMKAQVGKFTLCGDGLCVGYDSADAISEEYKDKGTYPFKNGTIHKVVIKPEGTPEISPMLLAGAFAAD
ncbi:MAG: arylsulfatase [Candidatus Competibacteraceae bacterium]